MLAESKPEVQGHLPAGLLAVSKPRGSAMEGAARHDNPQSSVPLDVAVAEKGSPFYGNRQPFPRRKTWAGKNLAVLDAAIIY